MDFFTVDDLAEMLHVRKATIYSWTHLRKIPYIKMGKRCLFPQDEIAEWIKAKRVPPEDNLTPR
jgi:excisionase family DNA binding protein